MSYLVSGCRHFNLVLSHHDNTDPSTWSRDQATIVASMKREYEGWDEVAVALVDSVKSTLKWPLMTYPALESWRHPSGRFALLGDACHGAARWLWLGLPDA